jgi:tetratricopeptide (TPR) repeat protein
LPVRAVVTTLRGMMFDPNRSRLPTVLAACALSALAASARAAAPIAKPTPDPVIEIVTRIQRADYEGDRAALARLHDELTPFAVERPTAAASIRYWQGFARWRRALNGFNDAADPTELEADLRQAVEEFGDALNRDPAFVDARVGQVSCLQSLAFLHAKEPEIVKGLVARFVPAFKESVANAPDNPRVLWVVGMSEWYSPPGLSAAQVEERHAKALATYRHALDLARRSKLRTREPLEPSWGEPELLMSLAWSTLNQTTPDPDAAEDYARQALALVPYWHYVRDILLPQIQTARKAIQKEEQQSE